MLLRIKKQSGMVLVLAVLIIAAVLATTAIFTSLIIREIQQSRLVDQSIQSYYLAESGSEKVLYQVRRMESIIDCGLIDQGECQTNGYCSEDQTIPCANKTGSLGSLGDWKVEGSNETETSILLRKGESFQIDLFNPYQPSQSNINEIKITSGIASGPILIGELINLTNILKIKDPSASNCLYQLPILKARLEFAEPVLFVPLDILSACSYTFRLNYPFDSVDQNNLITINVYNQAADDTLTPLVIPSRIIINSSATFGRSFQNIIVRTPVRSPLSGLYDFVLFSEQEIVK